MVENISKPFWKLLVKMLCTHHFSRENRAVLHSSVEGQHYKPFTSSDVVSSFSIFDPRKVPATSSPLFSLYGEGAIDTNRSLCTKLPSRIISLDVRTECKTYCQLLSKQPKDNLKTQLLELATNDTLMAFLPNLHKLACCCLSLPIGTASVERYFFK